MNNFGIHPKYLPLSKIRHDVGLHMICSTCRKVLYVFRQHVDRYSYDNVIFEIFNMLWENTFYRNQFRYCEVLSHIDGSHVTKLINNTNDLVSLIKTECEDIVCLIHMCQLLLLLPKLTKFWKKVKIDSSSLCAEEIKEHVHNVNQFYYHGSFTIFTNTTLGDRETFYCHIAKHWVLKIAKWKVDNLGCGDGLWTIQGFEHRNKQSKYLYSHKKCKG